MTWETFFLLNSPSLIPRLRWYITNIDLLHKTKKEDRLNRLQLHAQQAEPDDDNDNDSHVSDDGVANRMQIDFDDSNFDDIPTATVIKSSIPPTYLLCSASTPWAGGKIRHTPNPRSGSTSPDPSGEPIKLS
jgi:hypothetical protein